MITTIDAAGRLVIPREVRRQARLRPGMKLDVRWRDGRIEIEPAPLPIEFVRRGRLLVATARAEARELKPDAVEYTRKLLRRERSSEL